MSDATPKDDARADATMDEFSRRTKAWVAFRDEVLGRDPDAIVERDEAAAVLSITRDELDAEVAADRLGTRLANGEHVIRASDLRTRYDADRERFHEFAKGLSELRNELDFDDE